MAQSYDVSLKALFLRDGDGIIRRLLFGGKVTEFLATEQPQVSNRRADLVARTEDGALHQVEFQASNEPGFSLRMLDYYCYLVRQHEQHVSQIVLYLGREPMRLQNRYSSPSMDFRFEIINLREFAVAPLLASEDWADNALALLADGEPERALSVVIPRIVAMPNEERRIAEATLLLLSGIIGLEETVDAKFREAGMIDVMQNKVLGPIIQQRFEQGRTEGRTEGISQVLQSQLAEKFGVLPAWAMARLSNASADELNALARRILTASSIEETLG